MQEENETAAAFVRRTDLLAQKARVSLRELGSIIGISKPTLFRCRSGATPISRGTWAKLESAERKYGIMVNPGVDTAQPTASHVDESRAGYSSVPAGSRPFSEYLAMLRGIREEAEKLAGGDPQKTIEIFDRLMDISHSILTKRRSGNSANPFGTGSVADEARAVFERIRAEAEESVRREQSGSSETAQRRPA